MEFMKDFIKSVEKIDGISLDSDPPKYWITTGCYNLNKIISGSFYNGIPQGRVLSLAGPSGSGKSFLLGNIIKNAQKEGVINIVVDSERSLSDDFMQKIGVDTKHKDYMYIDVTTIDHVVKVISDFLKLYKKEYNENNESAPKVIISIDSLDMLLTEAEDENFNKGVQKGDQGQKTKQLKAMLKTIVNGIKHHNISVITTSQVYKNQDLMNGEGVWIINNAVKYCGSQTLLLTKIKLRGDDKQIEGIKMMAEGVKTRFTKPFQKITIEVPYETGMNKYSGLLETFVAMNVLEQRGSWYYFTNDKNIKFQAKNIEQYAEKLMEIAEKIEDAYIDVSKKVVEVTDE